MHPFFFRFFNINTLKEKNDKDRECEKNKLIKEADIGDIKTVLKMQGEQIERIIERVEHLETEYNKSVLDDDKPLLECSDEIALKTPKGRNEYQEIVIEDEEELVANFRDLLRARERNRQSILRAIGEKAKNTAFAELCTDDLDEITEMAHGLIFNRKILWNFLLSLNERAKRVLTRKDELPESLKAIYLSQKYEYDENLENRYIEELVVSELGILRFYRRLNYYLDKFGGYSNHDLVLLINAVICGGSQRYASYNSFINKMFDRKSKKAVIEAKALTDQGIFPTQKHHNITTIRTPKEFRGESVLDHPYEPDIKNIAMFYMGKNENWHRGKIVELTDKEIKEFRALIELYEDN